MLIKKPAFKNTDPQKELDFSSRIGYYYQSIFGRKFSSKFSLQLSPTLVHRNEVVAGDVNNIYTLGMGSRFKFSPRSAFVVDYFPVLNRPANFNTRNALSIGFDIEQADMSSNYIFQTQTV